MKPREPLTVGELKNLLKDVDDDRWVITEGCDCHGEASGIEYIKHPENYPSKNVRKAVLINRIR